MTAIPVSPSPAPAPSHSAPAGLPLLRLAFRPFYLGAALFATLALPLWIALWRGDATLHQAIPPMLWHAHEMLFGFAAAVIVGFLLTAGKAWTGLQTPRGAALGALAGLWLAARVAAVAAPYPLYAALDVALLPTIAVLFGRLLWRAGNRRNLPLAGILLLLGVMNLCFHLAALGAISVSPLEPLHGALGLVVIIETVLAGRVVPNFTTNATPGLKVVPHARLSWTALVFTILALGSWVAAPANPLTGVAFFAAAALQVARQAKWHPLATLRRPILWILHLSYAWLPLGFVLLACAALGRIPVSAGVHALAVGATGGLIIGMITRTARGHTGRPLQVSRPEVAAYGLVFGAAVCRTLLPLVAPHWALHFVAGAAVAWTATFLIYLVIYTPWLASTRLDGKDG
jgi:uncharacterized protein involved in response to NO